MENNESVEHNTHLRYYNRSALRPKIKVVISIASGLLCFFLSRYSITTTIGETVVNVPWSILFPIIVSMAFGWRYGLIASISGAAIYPFLLWGQEGWANFLTSFIYLIFFTAIGTLNGTDISKSRISVFYRMTGIFIAFFIIIPVSYRYLLNPLLNLNSSFTFNETIIQLNNDILIQFAIKDCINLVFISLLADLLLRLPVIRKLFGLALSGSMRLNSSIIIITSAICFFIWLSFIGLGNLLLHHSGIADGHYFLVLWIILLNGIIASRIVILYSERNILNVIRIKENEDYLKLQFEKMPSAYIVWDNEFRVKNWNPSAERVFGYLQQEVLGKTPYEIIVPEHSKHHVESIWLELSTSTDEVKSINDNITKDGKNITCQWINTALKDNHGKITEVISMVDDITERKKVEETLRFNEERFNVVTESSGEWVWEVDQDGLYTYSNAVVEKILGYKPEELIGKKYFYDLFEQDVRLILKDSALKTFRKKVVFKDFVNFNTHKNGQRVILKTSGSPIINREGKLIGYRGADIDITEQKQIEAALRESEEKYRSIFEKTKTVKFIVDPETKYIVDANPAAIRYYGYSIEELRKMRVDDINTMSMEEIEQEMKLAIEEKRNFFIFKHKKANKEISTVEVYTTPFSISGKSYLYVLVFDISARIKAEQALSESEEKYRLAFLTSPDSVNINQLDGRYVDINEGFTKLTGYQKEEVIGKLSSEIEIWAIPEDREKLVKGLMEFGVVSNLETKFRLKDGSLKTGLMSARVIKINNVPHILSITRDITVRKELEEALKESEEQYRMLFERSSDAIFIVDMKTGRYLDANKSAEMMTGYKLKELKKLRTFDLTPKGAYTRRKKILNQNSPTKFGEVSFIRSDGKTRTALLSAIPLNSEIAFSIAHDITERKQYEDALRILSRAIDQSPVSVVITDTKGNIEYVNPRFTKITGYSLEESLGNNPRILKSGKTSDNEYKNMWDIIRSGKEWSGEFCNVKKNGELYWEAAIISPVKNEKGKISHFVAVKEDITEKKETDRKILSSIIDAEERERGRFSRELHDGLGPLLSTIKLYFQWLAETDEPDKRKIIIEKGDKNLNDAIETIREISNNLSPRTLNTFGLVAALQNFVENLNQTQKLFIEFTTNTNQRFENNIEVVLYRISSELLNNTIKYANASRAEIKLLHDIENKKIALFYSDNGKGADPKSLRTLQKGLGLVNIEQRVNTLNGTLKIKTEAGKGFEVMVEIPINN